MSAFSLHLKPVSSSGAAYANVPAQFARVSSHLLYSARTYLPDWSPRARRPASVNTFTTYDGTGCSMFNETRSAHATCVSVLKQHDSQSTRPSQARSIDFDTSTS